MGKYTNEHLVTGVKTQITPKTTEPIIPDKKIVIKRPQVKAQRKKKTLGTKVKDTFLADGKEMGRYLYFDILVPAVKNTIYGLVMGGIERTFFKDTPPSNINRWGGNSYTAYGSNPMGGNPYQTPSHRTATHGFDEIEFHSRREAEQILSYLASMIHRHGSCPVSRYYEACGTHASVADERYGWTNISQAYVQNKRNGKFIIVLPTTILL